MRQLRRGWIDASRRGGAHRCARREHQGLRVEYADEPWRPGDARRPLASGSASKLEGPRDQRARRSDRRRGTAAARRPMRGDRRRGAPAMRRARIVKPLRTGIRVIDLFTPICAGQRIGVFAGSGVGKSTLLAMLARLARLRRRGDRVGRRARPRGARISRRCAGGQSRLRGRCRRHRRRKPDDAPPRAANSHGGRRVLSRQRRIRFCSSSTR